MYNFYINGAPIKRCIVKSLIIMKITLFFLVISMLPLGAKTHAQTISLNKVNAPLSDIFKSIRQQTDYDFVYSKKQISTAKTVTITVKNASIDEVLELCFQNQPISYIISSQSILIKVKPVVLKTIIKTIAIKGRVLKETGDAISGATVEVENSGKSTKTDEKGDFELKEIDEQAFLTISFVGFQTKRLSIKADLMAIVLLGVNNKLDEVQVIGYGTSTQRYTTGSTSRINSKEIDQQPVTNALSALSGRLPGVFVQTTNGLPGGNVNIQIRGKGSIAAGTDPLYIIDGVPYDGSSVGRANTETMNIAGAVSPLNNINPTDIESINVLKDADATSIYGSRGANGVIIITTKKAIAGKTRFNLSVTQGENSMADRPTLMTLAKYLQMRREAFANDKLVPSSDPLSPNYAPDLTVWSQNEGTDWVDYIFGKTAKSTDIQTRVSGGKENTTFSVSGNFHREGTILPGQNNYLRGGITSQFQHSTPNNAFKIGIINQFSKQLNKLTNIVNNIDRSFLIAPNYPLRLADGTLNWYSNNILAETNAKSKTNIDNNITNVDLSYSPVVGLRLKVNSGYTKSIYDQVFIFPSSALSPGVANNTNFTRSSSQSFIVEPQADYQIKIGRSTVSILTGATYQSRNSDRRSIIASNFILESLMENTGSAGTIASNSGDTQYRYASVFGRLTYNLRETYIVNLSVRRDGSSRFAPNKRFGNFGSIAGAWLFSNNGFFKSQFPVLSFGKIRVSYGSGGNDQITDYGYLSSYSSPGSALYQGVAVIRPNRISNDDFKWESTNKFDIGLEFGLFEDAVSITADYYYNRSKDQLISYSIPQLSGFASYQANLPAVIQNKGLEISISSTNIKKKMFKWSSSFNITLPKNELESFENFASSSYAATYELGYDISRIRGYRAIDVDPNTGKVRYAGSDGVASTTPFANYTLGKSAPDFYGGLGNNISYRNFEVNLFLQFVKQVSKGGLNRNPGGGGIFNDFDLPRWTSENPVSNIPPASTQFDFLYSQSSINIFNTSYLRLKSLSVSYNFPYRIVERLGMNMVTIVAEGQNLLTLWNRHSAVMDPESGAISTTSGLNIPPLKTLAIGLKITL